MTFFLVIDLFNVLIWYFSIGGAKSVADIDNGGKILTFQLIYNAIVTFSAPRGAQTPLPTSILRWGGHGRIGPLDPPLFLGNEF